MISFDMFKKFIEAIKKQHEKETKFTKALESICDGFFVSELTEDITNMLVTIMETELEDTSEWLTWWMYEKDFGTRKDMTAYYADESEIKLDTVEEIYNFLIKNMEEKNESK